MRKEKRKRTVCLAAAVILTCYLVQTTDCYRLRKTEKREERTEADAAAAAIGVQEGKIVFGKVIEKGSDLESQVIDGRREAPSNASAEDEAAYQADFAGWSKGQIYDTTPREAAWKRMSPSLQCSGEQMKFRVVGPGASQIAVEQGNAPAVPLSQVPSTCGYSMQRNALALVMLVPYDGCNVIQEGGSYVLPLRWQGIPVSLWCSKPSATALTTASPVPQTLRYPPLNPQVPPVSQMAQVPQVALVPPVSQMAQMPQVPQVPPVSQVPQMPQIPQVPQTSKNPDATNPQVPQSFFFPSQLYPQYSSFVPQPGPTAKKQDMAKFTQYPHFLPPFYSYLPPPFPVTTAAPATAKLATKATSSKLTGIASPQMFPLPGYPPFPQSFPWALPAGKSQLAQFPHYMPLLPPYPPLFHSHIPQPPYPNPKQEMTTGTTTEYKDPSQTPIQPHHLHSHPHGHLPFPVMPYPSP